MACLLFTKLHNDTYQLLWILGGLMVFLHTTNISLVMNIPPMLNQVPVSVQLRQIPTFLLEALWVRLHQAFIFICRRITGIYQINKLRKDWSFDKTQFQSARENGWRLYIISMVVIMVSVALITLLTFI